MSSNLESGAPRSLESGVQRSLEGVSVKYVETGRSFSVAVTPAATTQADYKNTLLGVPVISLVTGVDNKQTGGKYSDIGLLIGIGCSVDTATHRAKYHDAACLFPVVSTVTSTDRSDFNDVISPLPIVSTVTGTTFRRFDATGRSIAITATMTATTRRKIQQVASVPIVVTLAHTDNKWSVTVLNHAAALYLGGAVVSRVYSGAVQVWP